ncbi:MAG: hypothetical protein F6K62_11195 [Sphaerospermopsis sp. SIO1G2]|nr:hypothetical protein [Sphaerospermopsis sp. SIO1G2]
MANDSLDGSGVITLSSFLDAEALNGSIVATRAQMMLEYARDNDGIGLTASGALNRKFLSWAVEAFDWPSYESAEVYTVNKVVDQIDYLPGWYLHEVMKRRKLMRKHKNQLLLSPAGRRALEKPGILQAEIFPETFVGRYLASLDYPFRGSFDLYFGLLLWKIRHITQNWASARDVFNYAVISDDEIHEQQEFYPDSPIHCFHLRILRFLCWFGLLECIGRTGFRFDADDCRYRSTPLFDRFVHFHLVTDSSSEILH